MSSFNSVRDIIKPPDEDWQMNKWHWLSGEFIPQDWNQTTVSGAPVFSMVDAIGQGFGITTPAALTQAQLDFGSIRHYRAQSCRFNADARRFSSGNTSVAVGMCSTLLSAFQRARWGDSGAETFKRTLTSDGASTTSAFSSVPVDTVFTNYDMDLQASAILYSINGTLAVTVTTTLPSVRLMPAFLVANSSPFPAIDCRIKFLEATSTF